MQIRPLADNRHDRKKSGSTNYLIINGHLEVEGQYDSHENNENLKENATCLL